LVQNKSENLRSIEEVMRVKILEQNGQTGEGPSE